MSEGQGIATCRNTHLCLSRYGMSALPSWPRTMEKDGRLSPLEDFSPTDGRLAEDAIDIRALAFAVAIASQGPGVNLLVLESRPRTRKDLLSLKTRGAMNHSTVLDVPRVPYSLRLCNSNGTLSCWPVERSFDWKERQGLRAHLFMHQASSIMQDSYLLCALVATCRVFCHDRCCRVG